MRFHVCLVRPSVVLMLAVLCSSVSLAQDDGGGDGDGGDVNVVNQPIAGVEVDAAGVLRVKRFDPRVGRARVGAARQALPADLQRPSPLRKVSLNRLEAALGEVGQPAEAMRAMAGLTRIEYVFYYPETGDIVIAGPAEPFAADASGRLRGLDSGQPVLLLEDMVTALRAYGPNSPPTGVISVSIDPTAEGLQRLQQVIGAARRGLRPSDAGRLAAMMKNNLGLQTVSIRGIPTSTHFARVLVEADYRMKLIGIGLEKLPLRFASYVDRAAPQQVARNAMERWYFEPNYEGVTVSRDGLAMQLSEHGVKLVGAHERVGAQGQRAGAGRGNRASEAFCLEFTEKYDQIARVAPVYAQLRLLIDASIAAAYIQEQDFYGQAGWQMPLLGDESLLSVETHTAPEQVETAVNAIWKGNTLMTPLGGGVNVQPRLALSREHLQVDEAGANDAQRATAGPERLKPGQWWWD